MIMRCESTSFDYIDTDSSWTQIEGGAILQYLFIYALTLQMAVEVAKRTTARQGNLKAAFSLLDVRHQEWIDGATMIALFLAIGRYRCATPLNTVQANLIYKFQFTIMRF